MGRIFRRFGSNGSSLDTYATTTVDLLPEIHSLSLRDIPETAQESPHSTSMSSSILPALNIPCGHSTTTTPNKLRVSVKAGSSISQAYCKGSLEVGLENLGNSCFMNSSLQCLLHIEPLTSYFLSGNHLNELNLSSPLQGQLATAFGQLAKDVFDAREGSVVAPVPFFRQLRTLAPHLADYQQQDSQEFLRFVLDGLCEDLCRRSQQSTELVVRRKSGIMSKEQMLAAERSSFRSSSLRMRRPSVSLQPPLSLPLTIEDRTSAPMKPPSSMPILKSPTRISRVVHGDGMARPEVDSEEITAATQSSIDAEARRAWDAYMRFNDSVVADIFAGQLQSTVTCLTCKHRSYSFDPFLDLSVPIPPTRNHEPRQSITGRLRGRLSVEMVRCSLEECLQNFASEELLEGDNMISCDRCGEKRAASKRLSLFKCPKVLVIQIKRFRTGKFSREKLNTDVVFPLKHLDLSPFLSTEKSSTPTSPPLYDLIGISHHSGTMHGGHYVATIDTNTSKDGTQKWVNFNDGIITTVGSNSLSGPSAYVLFYQLSESK